MGTRFHLRVWTRFLASPDDVWRQVVDPGHAGAGWGPLLSRPGYPAFGEDGDVAFRCAGLPVGVGWKVHTTESAEGARWVTEVTSPLFADFSHERVVEAIPDGWMGLDIGPDSAATTKGAQVNTACDSISPSLTNPSTITQTSSANSGPRIS